MNRTLHETYEDVNSPTIEPTEHKQLNTKPTISGSDNNKDMPLWAKILIWVGIISFFVILLMYCRKNPKSHICWAGIYSPYGYNNYSY